MKAEICSRCGANDWTRKNGCRICNYCGTTFRLEDSDIPVKESEISLNDDVKRLLEKCKNDPKNAKRYANLVLDIDPSNEEAVKYI